MILRPIGSVPSYAPTSSRISGRPTVRSRQSWWWVFAGGAGEDGVLERDAPERGEEHISHGGEPEAELVGGERGGGGAVGEEVELTLLDPVLHLAALAVEVFVELAARDLVSRQRRDHEARVCAARQPLRLAQTTLVSAIIAINS